MQFNISQNQQIILIISSNNIFIRIELVLITGWLITGRFLKNLMLFHTAIWLHKIICWNQFWIAAMRLFFATNIRESLLYQIIEAVFCQIQLRKIKMTVVTSNNSIDLIRNQMTRWQMLQDIVVMLDEIFQRQSVVNVELIGKCF